MGVEIVQDDVNLFDFLKTFEINQFLDELRKIGTFPLFGYFDLSKARFGFYGQEDVPCAVSLVFIIRFLRFSLFGRLSFSLASNQLFAFLVYTDDRLFWIILFIVKIQKMFHSFYERWRHFRNAPHFFPAKA